MHLIHLIIHLVRVGKGQGLTFNLILVWLYTASLKQTLNLILKLF